MLVKHDLTMEGTYSMPTARHIPNLGPSGWMGGAIGSLPQDQDAIAVSAVGPLTDMIRRCSKECLRLMLRTVSKLLYRARTSAFVPQQDVYPNSHTTESHSRPRKPKTCTQMLASTITASNMRCHTPRKCYNSPDTLPNAAL